MYPPPQAARPRGEAARGHGSCSPPLARLADSPCYDSSPLDAARSKDGAGPRRLTASLGRSASFPPPAGGLLPVAPKPRAKADRKPVPAAQDAVVVVLQSPPEAATRASESGRNDESSRHPIRRTQRFLDESAACLSVPSGNPCRLHRLRQHRLLASSGMTPPRFMAVAFAPRAAAVQPAPASRDWLHWGRFAPR